MEQVFVYNSNGVMSLIEPSASDKREKVKETINKALKVYPKHSVFTLAILKKGLGCFDCFVIPNSADLPGGINPSAFRFHCFYKNHWKAVPETLLDQIQEWSL